MNHLKLLPLLLISAPMMIQCMDVSPAMYARCLIGGGTIALFTAGGFSIGSGLCCFGCDRLNKPLSTVFRTPSDSEDQKPENNARCNETLADVPIHRLPGVCLCMCLSFVAVYLISRELINSITAIFGCRYY